MRHEFDELAVSLTNGESRRTIVRKLAVGALGAFGLISLAVDEAEANGAGIIGPPKKKRKPKKPKRVKCAAGRKRCGTRCCRRNQVCKQGKCRRKPKRNPNTPECTPIPRDEACAGRQCGTADDNCGKTYDCGPNDGACPAQQECRTAPVCNEETGQCVAGEPANQGGRCGANDTGMCVDGTCQVTNATGTCTAPGVSACNDPGTGCGDGCVCYTTIEGGGFCIDSGKALCPDRDPSRNECELSSDCGSDRVCVSLDDDGSNCCGSNVPGLGFCVPLSARCLS